MRLDIVTNDAGELVRREHARDLGAGVVISLYRLARLAQMHDLGNQAFVRQLEQTHQSIGEYCLRAGTSVNVLFAEKAVFIAGQVLKGSRTAYESATELASIVEWCGGSELTIARDVTPPELLAFAEAISAAMKGEKGRAFKSPSPRIRLRAVNEAARHRGVDIERLPLEQRIVRNYATAVVVLRRFFEDLAASKYVLPRRIKRVAQNLVDLSNGNTPAFLGVTEVRNQNHDAAGRAVNTAILAVAMAREILSDRSLLSQIAMAAMMYDVGRPRAAALATAGAPRMSNLASRLTEDAEDRLPNGTAAVLTALGRVNEPSITRTVIAFESLWLRRGPTLGPVYRGARPATLHARIVTIARKYNDVLTPEPGLPPPSPEGAIAILADELTDPADRTVLRMLVSALGLVPVGTVVQLSSGEVGEVIAGGAGGAVPGKPRVRVAMDASGAVLSAPSDVDLGRAGESRTVARVMSIDGWRKGADAARSARGGQEPSSPSRSAVVPTEPRVPVAMAVAAAREPAGRASPPPVAPRTEPAPAPRTAARDHDPPSAIAAAIVQPIAPPAPPAAIAMPITIAPGAKKDAALRKDVALKKQPALTPEGGSPTYVPPARTEARAAEARIEAAPIELPEEEDPGTSPSAVAEAMGRMIEEALRGSPPGRTDQPPPRTPPPRTPMPTAPPPPQPATIAELKAAAPATMPPEDGQAPSARGTLGGTPLAHVLVYMLDHALTGSIVFREPDGPPGEERDGLEHVLHFQIGAVSKVQVARPSSRIGDELVAAGYVTRAVITEAVEGARRLGVLIGEYLVGHDLVPRDALLKALETQIASRVASIVNLPPETTYSFYRDVDLLEAIEAEGVVSDPLNVILATVRAWHDRARIRATLARIAKHPLAFHGDADPLSLSLTPGERTVVEHMRASRPTTVALFQQRLAEEEAVSSLIYALAVTRQFALRGQKKAPMGGRGAPIPISIAPPAPSEDGSIPVPPSMRASELPDDLGRLSALPGMFPPATGFEERASEDAQAIGGGGSRTQPNVWRPPPGSLSERPAPFQRSPSEVDNVERALEAMTHFRLAESALQRGDFAQAERLAGRAAAGDPEQADYLALHAWVRATGSATEDVAYEALDVLTRLLATEADNERALFYRGKLNKRIGRVRDAQRDLERLLQINPRHREAATELRLLKQRNAK